MYLRLGPAAWAGGAEDDADGLDDEAPEGAPGASGGRWTLMPPPWGGDVPEEAEATGTSGMKSETTFTRRCRSVSEG